MTSPRAQQASLALALAALAGALVATDALSFWERDAFDALARADTDDAVSERVALIMLDEASLDWGRAFYDHARAGGDDAAANPGSLRGHEFLFPWDRSVYDLLVQFAALGGARVLALDVELAGPHPSGDGAGDATLGLSTRMQNEFGGPYVVHAFNLESSAAPAHEVVQLDALQRDALAGAAVRVDGWRESGLPFARSDVGAYSNPVLPYRGILAPLADAPSNLRLGAVTAQPDPDGVIRRARPFVVWGEHAIPSLGVAAALAWADAERAQREPGAGASADGDAPQAGASSAPTPPSAPAGADLAVHDGRLLGPGPALPLTSSGDLLLRWRDDGREGLAADGAPLGRYPTWPAHRVLRSAMRALGIPGWEFPGAEPEGYFLEPGALAGRMVFLGANAAGLRDLKATPVSADYPGVKVHAAVAEALLDGHVMARPALAWRAGAAALLAAAALLLTTRLRSLVASALLVLALGAAWAGAASWAFLAHGLWLDVVAPLAGVAAACTAGTTWQWFTAGRQSREITGLFQHFAPPDVVRRLIARPGDLFLRGENREITAFFSDIRGFTCLSNTPAMRADPSRLTEHLNAYLSEMTAAIRDCGGTVDKYIGDAVVAIFGAPEAQVDHAARACRAALLCQERLAAFNDRARGAGLPEFVTRIGLCSGEATVGCVGSRERFSYTAIGPTVNFASRMEGVNKAYGTLVLAAGSTVERAGDAVRSRLVDRVRVPGLDDEAEPLRAHELLPATGGPDDGQLAAFAEARALYEQGSFAEAAEAFAAWPDDPPARVLHDRSLRLCEAPPEAPWDGSHRLTGK